MEGAFEMSEEESNNESLSYDNDSMKWLDSNGKEKAHPRYSKSPRSLDGKSFIKGYLRAVKAKKSLNDYMKTNQRFTAAEVQKAARAFRKILEEADGNKTFSLLPRRKSKKNSEKAKAQKAVLDSMKELGL